MAGIALSCGAEVIRTNVFAGNQHIIMAAAAFSIGSGMIKAGWLPRSCVMAAIAFQCCC